MDKGVLVGEMILVYETAMGWRYRVGQRDDGYYDLAEDAFWAGEFWIKNNHQGNAKAST